MINLEKGQKIDLTKKDGSRLAHILVGLGWEEAGKGDPGTPKKGLAGLFSKNPRRVTEYEIDIDASVFVLRNGRVTKQEDVVYYSQKRHPSGAVNHKGDNLVGGKMGGLEDSEQIELDLDKLPESVNGIAFVVNIYDCVMRKQDFGMVRNAYIRIIDRDANTELIRYSLTDEYAGKTSIIVGEAAKTDKGWTFQAIGEGRTDTSISNMLQKYK